MTRYSRIQIGLHWLTLVLFLANYVVSEAMKQSFDPHLEGTLINPNWETNFHLFVGIAVAATVTLRLLAKVFIKQPEPLETENTVLSKIASATHGILYLLMFLVPAAGLIAWFGEIEPAGDIHQVLVNVLIGAIGLHTAAALYHQYILKDQALLRMVPR